MCHFEERFYGSTFLSSIKFSNKAFSVHAYAIIVLVPSLKMQMRLQTTQNPKEHYFKEVCGSLTRHHQNLIPTSMQVMLATLLHPLTRMV